MSKKYLVFGAAGSIGSAVLKALLDQGDRVFAVTHTDEQMDQLGKKFSPRLSGWTDYCKVQNPEMLLSVMLVAMSAFEHEDIGSEGIDGVIYAVGHCPPQGFDEAVSDSLLDVDLKKFRLEIEMHQLGLLNVYRSTIGNIKNGGAFLVVSSATPRINPEVLPPPIHLAHYASACAAKNLLTRAFRHEPFVKEHGIKIHLCAFGAVATPFHEGSKLSPPPAIKSLDSVVGDILAALGNQEKHYDTYADVMPRP